MFKRVLFLSVFIIAGLFLLVIYQKITLDDGRLHLVFCDVGQGDAIFIRTPKGMDLLIDGGPDERVLGCLNSHMPFWDRRLEMVVLTHPQADHLTGLISVIKSYSVMVFSGNISDTSGAETEGLKQLKSQIAKRNIQTIKTYTGDKFRFKDGVSIRVIWPEKNGQTVGEMNDLSTVFLLTFDNFRSLFTADAGVSAGYQQNLEERIDVLKVPHHGSKTSLDENFFERTRPSLAVISVGKNNRYGHPNQKVISLLADWGVRTLRTDVDGEVEVVSDGKEWRVKRF